MPSDSDTPIKKRKPKTRRLRSSSSSSSSDDDFDIITKRTRIRQRVVSTDDDSDESIIVTQRQKKKMKVLSDIDTDSSSSDSEVASFSRRTKVQALKSESSGESDGDIKRSQTHNTMDFSTSDEDVEKCIICFKALRDVIARPSGCQHTFHSECLLTWSKTSNTCPIDRLKYTQIITSDCDGGIVARHNVTTPVPPDFNDLEPDDPTFCEICNQHDRENEMLLCDRCEAGYHLDCLDPPLIEVPIGDWYCPDCSGGNNALGNLDTELHDLLRDTEILVSRLRNRTQSEPRTRRVGPRTRAAQRVLQSIRQMAEEVEMNQPSTSRSSSTVRSRRRRRRTSASSRSTRYKLELVTVEDGSTIEVKVAVNTRKKSRSKKRKYKKCRNRSGKRSKRGSASGGGCEASSSIVSDLAQPLDIFGSRPQLDYFSGCESDDDLGGGGGGGDGLMVGRRARISHGRGPAVAKQMAAQILRTAPSRPSPRIAVSSAPPDLLSSILNEQTKWHSPNAVIQSNSEGQVTVTLPKSAQKIKKASGGEGSGSGSGGGPSGSSSGSSSGAGGGGRESSSTSLSSGGGSSSIPPLEPPPQPPKLYEDEDFDLYADIEPPLAPPPEPPALLLALEGEEGASSPEDAGLVIDDDRQTYDPELPTSPPPSPPGKKVQDKTKSKVEMVAVDLSAIRLPSPEPDPDPEIDDCPNRVFYSKTSISIAKGNEESDNEELPAPPPPPPLLLGKTSISPPSEEMDSEISEFSNGKLETEKSLEENKNIESKDVDQSEKYDPELSDEEDEVTKPSSLTDVDKNEKTSEPDNDNEPEKATVNDLPNDEKVIEKRDNEEEIVEAQDVDGETKVSEDVEAKNQITEDPTESVKQENKEVDLKAEVKDEINGECVINNMVEDKDKDDDDDDEGEEVAIKDENNKDSKSDISLKNEAIDEVAQDVKIESPKSVETKNEDVSLRDDETELEDKKETQDSPNETETKKTKRKSNDSSIGSSPSRKLVKRKADQEGDDVLELGCGDDKDGLVDITDEEISSYEKSWELEDNQLQNGNKSAGLEGLETEAISEGEDNMAEEGQIRTPAETGPKEEGEIISDEKRVPVAWKKVTKAKERSYRDKDSSKDKSKKKDKEKKPKEKRKELERYDVRKIISDKPKARKVDEFGRDISTSRSRSKSVVGSRSKSKSRSPKSVRSIGSIRSRRSRSRSLSKGRRRRSRERRSRSRSRDRLKGRTGRSRDRSRERERERNKRVRSKTKSRSRSRSESRRRRSRSRKKERRSRPKSRDKKRRKRESSLSCSSCSCSSCERERRKSKKLTVIVPNEPIAKKDKKKKYKDKGDRRRRVDSPVPSKEVFTSGDNILVSVNFSKSSKTGEISRKESSKKKKDDEPKKKKDKGSKENQPLRSIVSKSSQSSRKNKINAKNLKPVAIIDLAQSPFREQTLSPKEIIVLTDSESETEKRNSMADNMAPLQVTGPKTPPEPHIKFNIVGSKTQVLRTLTNPLLDSLDQLDGDNDEEDERADMLHKGPNTPPEPPVPYDPFEPTKSRSPSPIQNLEELRKPATPPGDKVLPPEPLTRPVSPPKPAPEPPKTPSPLHSPPSKPPEDNPPDKNHISPPNNHDDDSMDMGGGGGDSPYSPGSSDGDDMFEPPVPQMSTPVPLSKLKPRPPTKMTSKLTPSPLKRKPGTSKPLTPIKSKGSKKEVMGGMNEDQLKILDDLPNSAVEMQVKDKFLKKLNRQERVVEEVKMVLKPHYAKKHVTKEEYKEILRKSVPKICHSRSGEINPIKIQRLIEAYVKKYRHLRKKRKMPTSTTFSAPDLLKPKPKPTMWC